LGSIPKNLESGRGHRLKEVILFGIRNSRPAPLLVQVCECVCVCVCVCVCECECEYECT
jgi:hypothetical protein